MIKKIIAVLVIAITFMTSMLGYQSVIETDDFHNASLPDYIADKRGKSSMYFYLTFEDSNNKDALELISSYCRKNNCIAMMIQSSNNDGIQYVDRYLYSCDQDVLEGLKIKHNQLLDFSNISGNGYYTTQIDDKECDGYFTTIQDDYYKYATTHYRLHTLNDVIEALKTNNKVAMQIIGHTSEQLNSELKTVLKSANITYMDATKGYSPALVNDVDQETKQKVMFLLAVASTIVVLLLIFDILNHKKTIMIKILHGVSALSIFMQEFLIFFLMIGLLFAMTLYGFMYMRAGSHTLFNNNYYQLYSQYMMIFACLLAAFMCIVYVVIAVTTNLKYFKSRFALKYYMALSTAVKSIVICVLMTAVSSTLIRLVEDYQYYSVFSRNIDIVSHLGYIDGEIYSTYEEMAVFDYLNASGGTYVDFSTYVNNTTESLKQSFSDLEDDDIAEMAIDYPYIFANANYLKSHNIKDENGKILDLYQYDSDVILVPNKYKNEDIEKIMFGKELEIIYVQDNTQFMNYEMTEPYYMNNPVIRLITHKGDDSSLLYMYVDLSNKSIKEYQNDLSQLTQETMNIRNLSHTLDIKINNLKESVLEMTCITGMYVVFMLFFTYAIISMFIKEKQMEAALGYMIGKSLLERYQDIIMSSLISYIAVLIVGTCVIKMNFMAIITYIAISLIVEIATGSILIYRFQHGHVVSVLKGEVTL